LSEWAATSVASVSMISGAPALRAASGARSLAGVHTRARAAAHLFADVTTCVAVLDRVLGRLADTTSLASDDTA